MGPAAAIALLLALGLQSDPPAAPPPAPVAVPVSIERVHEGLQRPGLKIPPIDTTPVFRASVVEAPFESPLQSVRRELGENSGYRGGRGVDVLPLAMGVVNSIKAKYRAYSEARIRREVQAELDAFCAQHDCSRVESGQLPVVGVILPRRAREE